LNCGGETGHCIGNSNLAMPQRFDPGLGSTSRAIGGTPRSSVDVVETERLARQPATWPIFGHYSQ
jgi:hypothetical protein